MNLNKYYGDPEGGAVGDQALTVRTINLVMIMIMMMVEIIVTA